MTTNRTIVGLLIGVSWYFFASEGFAHPSSGIVVDQTGQVFFTDNGGDRPSLWKIDAEGKATRLTSGGWHWLALDEKGRYPEANLKKWFEQRITMNFGRVPLQNSQGALLQADGAPFVIDRDGNLCWGNLEISRLSPDGKVTLPYPGLKETSDKLGGIKGLAAGADGILYLSCPSAILKATPDGKVTTLIHPIRLSDVDFDLPPGTSDEYKPFLRGLAVDARATVYAGATGAHCLVRITPEGRHSVVLKSEKPWSPTGVAVFGDNVFVLEYTNANGDDHDAWRPRVRRLNRDGRVATLFTAPEKAGPTGAATRPLLVPAPGSPIAIAGGGALVAGDVNGDAFADLLLVAGKSLKVFFGGANRVWPNQPDVSVDLAAGGSEITLADVNHDGKQDVVIADHDSYAVAVLLGSGDGKFKPAPSSPFLAREGTQPHTHGLAVADVNGDGHQDIVTANNDDGDLSLLIGDGKGKFVRAPKSPFACGKSPYPIAATDINGDGHVDVLVPNSGSELRTLTILLGNGRGELTPAPNSPFTTKTGLFFVAAGDLNHDGRPDVVATHNEAPALTILINGGDGRLAPASESPLQIGHNAWGVEIADMDRDGNADLVVAADEHIRVFLGDGRGGFQPAKGSPFKTGKGAWRLTVGDFNGDGKRDVASKCVEANHIEIWLGN